MTNSADEPPRSTDAGEVTALLERVRSGEEAARERLLELVYRQLRALAGAYMRGQAPGHTLQPTALVHEAYLRLADSDAARNAKNRSHFLAMAARAMRQILVDHARGKLTAKRGQGLDQVTLPEVFDERSPGQEKLVAIVDLDLALTELSELHERQARVVECRFIAGMSVVETAEALGVSQDTVVVDTAVAKTWLRKALAPS